MAAPRIVAQSNVLNRMTGPQPNNQPKIPEEAWPNDEYFLPTKDFFFNGEAVVVYHVPSAHTDGDSLVFFRRSDVLSTGDVFTPGSYPIIDLARGGSVEGEINALNKIIDITVPAKYQEGGTMVIPGHGRLCDEADVVEYRNMLTVIRDRFHDMIKKGMTLEQVKAAKPTLDYDTQYGSTTGFWTTDMFIEAVYKSLSDENCEREQVMRNRLLVLVPLAAVSLLAQGVPPPSGIGPPGGPQAPKSGASSRTGGFHGLLGVGGLGRLALAHGDAHQGRFRQHTAEQRGPRNRQCLGSRKGYSGRRAMQVLWRARDHASARTRAH